MRLVLMSARREFLERGVSTQKPTQQPPSPIPGAPPPNEFDEQVPTREQLSAFAVGSQLQPSIAQAMHASGSQMHPTIAPGPMHGLPQGPMTHPNAAYVLRNRVYAFVLDENGQAIELGSGRFAKCYLGEER